MDCRSAFCAVGRPTQLSLFVSAPGRRRRGRIAINQSYLAGNFAPVRSEDDFDLEVDRARSRPAWPATFYRNGPNPQFEPRDAYHWFSGDGMIHAFFVEDGKVRYRNRYVRTPKWELEHAAGQALFGTFGNPMTTDPSVMGKDSGVANTNIVWHAGQLLALEEGHRPFELDPATLESRGYRRRSTAARSPPTRSSIPRPARWSGSPIRPATRR